MTSPTLACAHPSPQQPSKAPLFDHRLSAEKSKLYNNWRCSQAESCT